MSTVAARLPVVDRRERAVYTRTQVLGLSLVAGSLILLIVAALVAGIPFGDAAFLFLPIGAAIVGAAAAWRFGTWGKVVGLVGTLIAVGMTFWLAFGILEPGSYVEFTAGTAHLVGSLLALGGGITAIVKRHDLRVDATRTERAIDLGALAIVIAALAMSLPIWAVQRGTVSAEAAAGLDEIAMANFEFGGATEVVASGGEVSFVVRNQDPFSHTFTVDGVVDELLLPGASTIVTFPAEVGETITYYCIPHSVTDDGLDPEDDMMGTLTVTGG